MFLLRLCMKAAYFHGVAIALMPALFDPQSGQFRKSRIYLIYSIVSQIVIMLGMPLFFWSQARDGIQMGGDRMMQGVSRTTSYSRFLTFVIFSGIIWWRRGSFLRLYNEYWELMRRHANVLPMGASFAPRRRTQRIAIVYYGSAQILSFVAMFIIQREFVGADFVHRLWPILNMAMSSYTTVPSFFIILLHCHIFEQFRGINTRLECLLIELRRFANNDCKTVSFKLPKTFSEELDDLRAAHFDLYGLTLRIFRFTQVIYIFILVKWFTSNLGSVHGVAQILFFRQSAEFSLSMLGSFAVIVTCVIYTYNSVYEPLQTLLDACNDTGIMLRGYSELLQLRRYRTFQQTLDRFADHLRCHRLYFDVCGFFRFDQRSAVTCCFVVLVNFTVLLQFDMEFQTEERTKAVVTPDVTHRN